MTPSKLSKTGSLTLILIILASTIIVLSILPQAKAETKILTMAPRTGYVNTVVTLSANITTSGGTYELKFDAATVGSGSAVGNIVNATFTVPETFVGSHTVMITDTAAGQNATDTFTILTAYALEIPTKTRPLQFQESDSVTISLNVTGGEASTTNLMNFTVQTPSNASSTQMINLTTSSAGSGTLNVTYPSADFGGSNTSLVGTYTVLLNTTLVSRQFTIGLTNATDYHRFDTVNVRALYAASENVTLTIFGKDAYQTVNLTADTAGMIDYSGWSVPSNATIGVYTVNITSISGITQKVVLDAQNFTVPGFNIDIFTQNLAGEGIPSVSVEAFENDVKVANATGSIITGVARLNLELGEYICNASYTGRWVGQLNINVSGNALINFPCNLTNIGISVKDQDGIFMPQIKVQISPQQQTLTTDINGSVIFHSLLPNINYTLNMTRYNLQFNTTTITQLPTTAWFNITVIVPKTALQVLVTDTNQQPVNNATVKASEITGGLFYQDITVDGTATLNCTLGKYTIEVYVSNIKLNETAISLNETATNISMNLALYGLNISFRVVDYFGQPISNVNITSTRATLQLSGLTSSDGTVTFPSTIGGNLQVSVCLHGQTQPSLETIYSVTNSTTINIGIDEYVSLGGFLIQTSHMTTVTIIIAIIIVFLLTEIYIMRRRKAKKTES